MTAIRHRLFVWRTFTSVFLAACFTGAVLSGAILFLSPPGRIANWTDWNIAGLAKQEWAALHVSFSAVFLIVAAFHVFFNWRPLVSYFKDRVTRRLGWRREWVSAVVVAGVVGWTAVADLPPFGWLVAAGERLKQRWDRPAARAPIPHAELLTLGELAARANVEPATAAQRLDRAGIRGHSPGIVVEEVAKANRVPAQRIYEILQGQAGGPGRGGGAAGRGGEGGGGRGAGGAGHGGGLGWKTLEQMCADEGLAVAEVLGRLQTRGVKAEAGQTLREIANANGYDRPFELVELIRGTAK
jgi:uncharacterized membrane protein YgcG